MSSDPLSTNLFRSGCDEPDVANAEKMQNLTRTHNKNMRHNTASRYVTTRSRLRLGGWVRGGYRSLVWPSYVLRHLPSA